MNKLITFILLLVIIACKSPEARRPISVKSGSFIDASVERNKKLNAKEEAIINKYMKLRKDNEYIASGNGFWYYYNVKNDVDSLKTPDFGDIVNYNYNLKSFTGQTIYTTEELKTRTYTIDKEELFSGLREGLKLMKTGETVTFLFPSQKAFGYYGDENKIGSNTPIICEVTLNSIIENTTN
ncbi:gliding motility-associated peptidyl-prolyl isomerase GldI [Siansivirga zeaxanthinifaciens]|uniref:Peptidyl-prolyl cis-trans isomerase n=1 Tax=Siansivirga zeaxanthinifaciens CC-SAMT-1 TaxID=1454006 RepID=A0A0C5VX48_9FLAO|nr:gliding motility-associated peptidyl-prolyl isomerase GldI [Siansivirga zeaxanthinifaciens]AJR03686.1 gliding motility protein GldI [Siansivirga zeaxanthinifaciens CC-SAMT-1]